jgi:non-lysosomal glucosylceramidase
MRSRSLPVAGLLFVMWSIPGGMLAANARAAGNNSLLPAESAVSVSLGGIGTGKVDLRSDGSFGGLTFNNNGGQPVEELPGSFFALRVRQDGAEESRVLADRSPFGFPTAGPSRFESSFPRASASFPPGALPVGISLTAFSSLVPNQLPASNLPAAVFTFTLSNSGDSPADAALAFSWDNVLGVGGAGAEAWDDRTGNSQTVRDIDGVRGLVFQTNQQAGGIRRRSIGEYALLAESDEGRVVMLPRWNSAGDGQDFWSAFTARTLFSGPAGQVEPARAQQPAGAVAAELTLAPGESAQVHFVLAWRLPEVPGEDGVDPGHAYAVRFSSAWDAAAHALRHRETLLSGVLQWQDLLARSSLPGWLKARLVEDAFPLYSNTFYTADERFFLLESPFGPAPGAALDQWLVTRTLVELFFPQCTRSELASFAAAQTPEGALPSHIPAGAGAQERVLTPEGACQFVLAAHRQYRWSGDRASLNALYPHVERALAWLRAQDADGDGLPEGGVGWGEAPYPGTLAYTGTLYLAALRAGETLAQLAGDERAEEEHRTRFAFARTNLLSELWNGRFFIKSLNPATAERSQNLFAGALAGDWAARSSGLGDLFDPEIALTALRSLLEVLTEPETLLVPNEVRPDGTLEPAAALTASAEIQTYLAALGISRGRADAGLKIARQLHSARTSGLLPGAGQFDAETGQPSGLPSQAGSLASWNVYTALTGLSPDAPGERLEVSPALPVSWNDLHAPLFGPQYWAWMDYTRSAGNAATSLRLRLIKRFQGDPVVLRGLTTRVPPGLRAREVSLVALGPTGPIAGTVEISGGKLHYTFDDPFEWRLGETLELTIAPPETNTIVIAQEPPRAMSYGSVVTVKEMSRGEAIRLSLVNPTPERQVVNLRFAVPVPQLFDVYQNGEQVGVFAPESGQQRLTLIVPASTVSPARIANLRRLQGRLEGLREQEGLGAEMEGRLVGLDERVRAALTADAEMRTTEIVLHRGRRGLVRQRLREPLEARQPVNPEPAILEAEAELDRLRTLLREPLSGVEPATRARLARALE